MLLDTIHTGQINIGEWAAIGGVAIALIGGWVKIQTNLTRIDSDLNNLKKDSDEDRKDNRAFFGIRS